MNRNVEFSLDREGLIYEHLEALAEFRANPIEKDPRIDAYRSAMLTMLAAVEEPATSSLEAIYKSNQTILDNPDIPPIYASNLYLRYLQSFLMDNHILPGGLKYPESFIKESAWETGMRHVAELDVAQAELTLCAHRSIQSNVFDRYKAVKLAVNMHEERFNRAAKILDVGCSQNIGLKAVETSLPFFSPTDIAHPVEPGSHDFESIAEEMIERQTAIGKSHGVDLYWPGDPSMAKWIKACSHYPSELLQKERVALYDSLVAYESPNIDFIWADFADPEEMPSSKINTKLPDEGNIDVAVLSTVLYQVSFADRKKMLERAYDLLSDDGLLIVQDFVRVHEDKPKQLDFSPWHHRDVGESMIDPYPYKAYVWDKTESNRGFQSLISWSNGRCEKAKLGDYALKQLGMVF